MGEFFFSINSKMMFTKQVSITKIVHKSLLLLIIAMVTSAILNFDL